MGKYKERMGLKGLKIAGILGKGCPVGAVRLLVFALIISLNIPVSGQKSYPKDYFRSPLDIPLNLSGNFGELRTNHFHAGLDIKTQQQEGLKVYAVADGYISRIKV